MIKVFFLIFEPGVAWDKIAQKRHGFMYITMIQVLPLILLATALEAWGLHAHGKMQWQPQMIKHFSDEEVITYGIIQFTLLFAMVFVSALLVYKISQTFQDRLTFLQAFTTIAYGFSPMLLVRFLDYGASINPVVTWIIGIALTMWILYQGIPRVMQPDPTHAFGVYLSAMIVVVLTSGLARLMTGMYVLGVMDLQHSWLLRRITHLLGHNPFPQ
jgi:hypothetical protein